MKGILKRIVVTLVVIFLVLIAGGGAWIYRRTHASLPLLDGVIQVPGLVAQVDVWRDARGVPHLRAQSLEDLVVGQGFVTAQDRLWQMDLSRRLAEGELSEVFGERGLRFDIENRTLGFRQACERAAADLDADTRRLLNAYTRGVNAFIETHRHRLPIEFLLLRYQPRPWRDIDSFAEALNMAKTLSTPGMTT
jgi:penicillin amidase